MTSVFEQLKGMVSKTKNEVRVDEPSTKLCPGDLVWNTDIEESYIYLGKVHRRSEIHHWWSFGRQETCHGNPTVFDVVLSRFEDAE